MEQYISKSDLVAEIERKMNLCKQILLRSRTRQDDYHQGNIEAYEVVISLLDTLEVKEVNEEPTSNDLEAEFVLYLKHKFNIPQEGNKLKTNGWNPSPYDILDIAKHFAQWQKEQIVKEVDLNKEIDNIWNPRFNLGWDEKSLLSMNHEGFTTIAKHFFELGLKAQQKGG